MSNQFIKKFSFLCLIYFFSNTLFAQTKQQKKIEKLPNSNLLEFNSKKYKFYKHKLTKYVPSGYEIALIFKGLLSDDKIEDYCIILDKSNVAKYSSIWSTNNRLLIVIVNTSDSTNIFRNDKIISPYYVSKGTCGILIQKNRLKILSRIGSTPDNECLFAEIFKYSHNNIFFDRYAEFCEKLNSWTKIKKNDKKELPFEQYRNNW